MSAAQTLAEMIDDGLINALYDAEQVARLDDKLGERADEINRLGFGEFFGAIQRELGRTRVLQLARIYDRPDPRFPSFSLLALLDFLQLHAEDLPILEKPELLHELAERGLQTATAQQEDAHLTRALVAAFRVRLPTGRREQTHPLDAALSATRTLRSKTVAHPERVLHESLPRPTYEELDHLLALAKEFVGIVSFAYLRRIDVDSEGSFLVDAFAGRASTSLGRLLDALLRTEQDA